MLPESPEWTSDVPAARIDHEPFEEFRSRFRERINTLNESYDALGLRRSSGCRDTVILGQWLNNVELKSTVITEILKEFLSQMREQRQEINELKIISRKTEERTESMESDTLDLKALTLDLKMAWPQGIERMGREFYNKSKETNDQLERLAGSFSSWTGSVESKFSELRKQSDLDSGSLAGSIKNLQQGYSDVSEKASKALDASQSCALELQSRCSQLAQELSYTTALAQRAVETGDSNALKLGNFDACSRLDATESASFEEKLKRAGLDKVGREVSELSQKVHECHMGICGFKLEVNQKLLDMAHASRSCEREVKDSFSNQASKLLALELQVQDMLDSPTSGILK